MRARWLWLVAGTSVLAGMTGVGVLGVALVVALRIAPHDIPGLWRVPYRGAEVGVGDDADAYAALEQLRRSCKARYRLRSGYRSIAHNLAVGGVRNSEHTHGRAFDLTVPMAERPRFYVCARQAGFTGYGWGNHSVHIDTGPRRWWTYDDQGRTAGGSTKYSFLHKAPANFREDWSL